LGTGGITKGVGPILFWLFRRFPGGGFFGPKKGAFLRAFSTTSLKTDKSLLGGINAFSFSKKFHPRGGGGGLLGGGGVVAQGGSGFWSTPTTGGRLFFEKLFGYFFSPLPLPKIKAAGCIYFFSPQGSVFFFFFSGDYLPFLLGGFFFSGFFFFFCLFPSGGLRGGGDTIFGRVFAFRSFFPVSGCWAQKSGAFLHPIIKLETGPRRGISQ